MSTESKNLTWRELKEQVNAIEEHFLDNEVMWWGEERGGVVNKVWRLEVDYVQSDYSWEEASAYEDDEDLDIMPLLPAGSPIISVD